MTNAAAADAGNSASNLDDILGISTPDDVEVSDAEKEPERQEEPKTTEKEVESDKEPEKKVLVPHGAFHEERERRKELQKQLADEKAARERLEERQNKIIESLTRRDKPDEEEQFVDPLTRMENKVNEVVEKINKKQEAETEEARTIREENELIQKYAASAQAYSKDAPDFAEAYNYLLANRQKELSMMGFSDAEVKNQLRHEEKLIVTKAYSGEKNPAEVLYSLAKERGYKSLSSDKSPKKTVEDIDKGLKASKSLGTGGAKSGDKDDLESLSASDLADMSNDEFNAFFNKIEKQSNKKH